MKELKSMTKKIIKGILYFKRQIYNTLYTPLVSVAMKIIRLTVTAVINVIMNDFDNWHLTLHLQNFMLPYL